MCQTNDAQKVYDHYMEWNHEDEKSDPKQQATTKVYTIKSITHTLL